MIQYARMLAAAAMLSLFAAAPAVAGKDVFVVDLTNDPASLDPHGQWNPDSYFVYRNVFGNLLTRDDEGKIVPQIATSWRQVDPSTVEFTLRADVKFHDGSALTAEDVAFSVRRITSPAYRSPQLSQFDKIVATEVVDPTTVRLKTDGPYPVLLAQLVKLSIVPKAHVEKVGSMLSPVHAGYVGDFQSYAFDLAKAKALMREAGVAPGTEFILFTSPTFDQRIVQALQQMVAELGVKVTIQSSDFANWLKRAQGSPEEFGQMTFSRWSCGCQDADGILFPLYHSSSQWAKFKNADIDKALDAGRTSLAEADRVAAYRRALEIAEANIPLVPLYQAAILYGARKEVMWTPTPNESFFLNRITWKD